MGKWWLKAVYHHKLLDKLIHISTQWRDPYLQPQSLLHFQSGAVQHWIKKTWIKK